MWVLTVDYSSCDSRLYVLAEKAESSIPLSVFLVPGTVPDPERMLDGHKTKRRLLLYQGLWVYTVEKALCTAV